MTQQQYSQLVDEALILDYYYKLGTPKCADWEYYKLIDKIRQIEDSGIVAILGYSPTQRNTINAFPEHIKKICDTQNYVPSVNEANVQESVNLKSSVVTVEKASIISANYTILFYLELLKALHYIDEIGKLQLNPPVVYYSEYGNMQMKLCFNKKEITWIGTKYSGIRLQIDDVYDHTKNVIITESIQNDNFKPLVKKAMHHILS